MFDLQGTTDDFASLSLTDLLLARDLYHFHLINKANVVGTAIAEKEGYPISWGRYCKYAMPAMILVVGVCNIYLVLRYF